MELANLSWPQLERVPRDCVVVIPLASTEQHSRHLPFSTDSHILRALVERVEEEVGATTLFLPIQWLAYSARHLAFKGTVSIPWRTYIDVVASAAESMIQAGFSRVLFLNAQFDNEPHLAMVLRTVRERRPGVSAIAVSIWALLDGHAANGQAHAGELETSLLLHLRPDLVQRDEMARDGIVLPSQFAARVIQYDRMDQRTHQGGVGDPEAASAEEGAQLFERIAASLIHLIGDFHDGLLTS